MCALTKCKSPPLLPPLHLDTETPAHPLCSPQTQLKCNIPHHLSDPSDHQAKRRPNNARTHRALELALALMH